MSAYANTSSRHQNIEPSIGNDNIEAIPSNLSVTTRIDYSLRFSKQTVLVVGESAEQYSTLASQYLVSLSTPLDTSQPLAQVNVAFVSASNKLNDIQIRCRLIEQLFVNTLFDPEQSLAVSVLKLAKQHGQAISIVIDHAHALSLQIKYELCQLVTLANKGKLTINVVLFGLTNAANQLAVNKSLFVGKVAVIEADTGQVISFDHKKLQTPTKKKSLSIGNKMLLVSAFIMLMISAYLSYELILSPNKEVKSSHVSKLVGSNSIITDSELEIKKHAIVNTIPPEKEKVEASSVEINTAILSSKIITKKVIQPANASDIFAALKETKQQTLALENQSADAEANARVAIEDDVNKISDKPFKDKKLTRGMVDNHYYANQSVVYEQGYIIQIAGFSDNKLSKRFIEDNPNLLLHSYKRLLNDNVFFVVTSKVYSSKADAKNAMLGLPERLQNRKPWLKDISAVMSEINTHKQ